MVRVVIKGKGRNQTLLVRRYEQIKMLKLILSLVIRSMPSTVSALKSYDITRDAVMFLSPGLLWLRYLMLRPRASASA